MKKTFLLITCVSLVCLSRAQRFFYLETGEVAERALRADLLKASQFVTRSALMSDYTIKAELNFQAESNKASLKIILTDSATFKTIYQTNEDYTFGATKLNPRIVLDMAMKTLIEEHINQIILCAKDDHRNGPAKFVELKKDKT